MSNRLGIIVSNHYNEYSNVDTSNYVEVLKKYEYLTRPIIYNYNLKLNIVDLALTGEEPNNLGFTGRIEYNNNNIILARLRVLLFNEETFYKDFFVETDENGIFTVDLRGVSPKINLYVKAYAIGGYEFEESETEEFYELTTIKEFSLAEKDYTKRLLLSSTSPVTPLFNDNGIALTGKYVLFTSCLNPNLLKPTTLQSRLGDLKITFSSSGSQDITLGVCDKIPENGTIKEVYVEDSDLGFYATSTYKLNGNQPISSGEHELTLTFEEGLVKYSLDGRGYDQKALNTEYNYLFMVQRRGNASYITIKDISWI